MGSKVLMGLDFGEAGGLFLVAGDPETHAYKIHPTTVELTDCKGQVEFAWLFEHLHPSSEAEAWKRFGDEARRLAGRALRSRLDELAHLEGIDVTSTIELHRAHVAPLYD